MIRSPLRSPLRQPLRRVTRPAGDSLTSRISAIYAAGRLGPMFDPSDLSTMFTTRTGGIPVGPPGGGTAQFVGMMLDRSQLNAGPATTLGAELVTNGDFATGTTGWTGIQSGWSVSGGVASVNSAIAGSTYIRQGAAIAGRMYEVTITVTSCTSGSVYAVAGGTNGNPITAVGTYTSRIVAAATTGFGAYAQGSTTVASVDNISVREVSLAEANLGPELAVNGGFAADTDWGKGTGWTISGGTAVATAAPSTSDLTQTINTVAGTTYAVTFTVSGFSAGGVAILVGGTASGTIAANGTYTQLVVAASGGATTLRVRTTAGSNTFNFDNLTVKSLPGYHALAANDTTARPQLSARVNLLTYTEDLSNAAWTKSRSTVEPAAGPSGVAGAYKIIESVDAGTHRVLAISTKSSAIATPITATVSIKAAGRGFASVKVMDNSEAAGAAVAINLATGQVQSAVLSGTFTLVSAAASDRGDGWWDVTLNVVTDTAMQANLFIQTGISLSYNSSYTGDGTSGILVWHPDLRPTNIHAAGSIPAYQRVVDAETYDSAGFPFRLIPNGSQDMVTSTITPGTDSVTVAAGVRKLSDAAQAVIMEFGPSTEVAGGNVGLIGPSAAAAATYRARSSGTVVTSCTTGSTFAAPLTSTLRVSADISSDSLDLAVNGTVAATSAADQGAGAYSEQVMNYFQRAGGTLRYSGQYFGSITLFGPQLSSGELATVESWLNSRTKAY